MKVSSSIQWYGLALAASLAAIVFAWLLGEPFILLVPIMAICIYGGWAPGLLSIGICAIAVALLLGSSQSPFLAEPNAYLRFVTFLAGALIVSLLINTRQRQDSSDRAEREARLIVESMPDLAWASDPDGNFIYVSPSVAEYFGRPGEELGRIEGTNSFEWERVVHPDDVDRAVKPWLHSLETGEPYQSIHRARRADGTYRWLRTSGRAKRDRNGRITGWYGTTVDVEEQMVAKEALRKSEKHLRQLIDTIPTLVWCMGPDGDLTYLNKPLMDFIGYTLDDLDRPGSTRMATGIQTSVHPDDRAVTVRTLGHSFSTGTPYSIKHRVRRADGVYRWIDARALPLRDEDGRIVRWYGVSIDIDDEMRMQEALRDSEQKLRQLVDTIPTLVWCMRPDGEPSYFNKPLMNYVGLTLEDLDRPNSTGLAAAIQAVVHPDDKAAVEKNLDFSFSTGTTFSMKYRIRRADGVYRWMSGRAVPLRDEDGRIVQWYGVCVDIDDEKRMQEALRKAQSKFARASQLASLAELSASIAHEINQPLAAVIANSNACQRWLSPNAANIEEARAATERIVRDANSAAEVVSRVRALFRHSAPVKTHVNVNEVIAEVCQMMNDEITNKNINLQIDLDESLPSTPVDRVQMQQVLVNLVRNGIDAMEETPRDSKSLGIRSLQAGQDALLVEIRDHGTGIRDPERIFEPFFTTKQTGMGMGLAICRSIIEAHEGRLWARPNEPRGTVFAISLSVRAPDS